MFSTRRTEALKRGYFARRRRYCWRIRESISRFANNAGFGQLLAALDVSILASDEFASSINRAKSKGLGIFLFVYSSVNFPVWASVGRHSDYSSLLRKSKPFISIDKPLNKAHHILMSMHTLVYTSFANKSVTVESLQHILQKSRRNNLRLNITGILVHYENNFLQVLEGKKATIEKLLYEKIYLDTRHSHIDVFASYPIEKRRFSNWSMGLADIRAEDGEQIEGFSDFFYKDVAEEINEYHQETAIRLLLTIKDQCTII